MSERKKITSEVMGFNDIQLLWKFAQNRLNLDIKTEEGIVILGLLALAWITGAHRGLVSPETTSVLLADSYEVFHLNSDTNVILVPKESSFSLN